MSRLIEELGWTLIEHPPYSPDIAPSDFYLYLRLQNYLRGVRVRTAEEIKEAISDRNNYNIIIELIQLIFRILQTNL